jgi:UDP-N-acetylmuramoylalanine-D-glutamate ligase
MERVVEVAEEQPQQPKQPEFVVPSQDTFTFQAPHAYPNQDAYLNLDNLNLSDTHNTSNATATVVPRRRHGVPPRSNSRTGAHLGRGAGQKRRLKDLNLGEIFALDDLGYGKDPFGSNGPKRSRHT